METQNNPKWDHEKGVWVGEMAKQQENDDIPDPLWIFGYGSLCFKYGEMQHDKVIDCSVNGYIRRFWQKSMDHRGTPETPGLVCTLICPDDIKKLKETNQFEDDKYTYDESSRSQVYKVYGKAFRIQNEARTQVLKDLDYREKGGYSRDIVDIEHNGQIIKALLYTGTIDNPAFLSDFNIRGNIKEQAKIIANTKGPSGYNYDYFYNLYLYLKEQNQLDKYMESLFEQIQKIKN